MLTPKFLHQLRTKRSTLFNLRYCTYLSALNHSYWIVGVTSGAVVVALLGMVVDPDAIRNWTNGMEFAMLALFLVIFTDQMRGFCRRGK